MTRKQFCKIVLGTLVAVPVYAGLLQEVRPSEPPSTPRDPQWKWGDPIWQIGNDGELLNCGKNLSEELEEITQENTKRYGQSAYNLSNNV